MIYDSPLWASDGWVIPEVASFKEEGLVTPEEWEGEKGKLKICCSKVVTAIFSPTSVSRDRNSRQFFWRDFTRPRDQNLFLLDTYTKYLLFKLYQFCIMNKYTYF